MDKTFGPNLVKYINGQKIQSKPSALPIDTTTHLGKLKINLRKLLEQKHLYSYKLIKKVIKIQVIHSNEWLVYDYSPTNRLLRTNADNCL